MIQHQKPVRRCHGCGLNLGERCAVYEAPRGMWHHRSCPGYGNDAMLREYQEQLAKHRESPRKVMRRAVAHERASTPHLQVNLPLACR